MITAPVMKELSIHDILADTKHQRVKEAFVVTFLVSIIYFVSMFSLILPSILQQLQRL